jgi:hypothetical protein
MFNLEAISRRERRRSWPLAMVGFAPQAAMAQVEVQSTLLKFSYHVEKILGRKPCKDLSPVATN